MNKLDELIKELCPNGVEYKELGDIAKVTIGEFVHKDKQSENAKYPVYNGGISNTGYYDEYNEEKNKIIISARGANAGYINRIFVNYWAGNSCYTINANDKIINWNFLYYVLKNKEKGLLNKQQTGSIPSISKKQVESILVPVPPLEVQDEIVRILDNFTALTAELTAELTARKKQYSWYRDYLLKFENKVKMVKIGDLFEFKNGINKDKGSFGKGTPIINYVNVYKKNKIYFEDLKGLVEASNDELVRYGVKRGDVFFTRTSETIEEIGYTSVLLEDIENCVFSGFLLRARPITDLLLPEYCAYCFSTSNIRNTIIKKSTYTTRALTNGTSLSQIEIPLPPLEVQKRIVEVLDNFEKICNDLNIGLPAEIEARQKQYEFYRNYLLTFKIENCILPKTRQDKTRQDIIKLFMYIFGYINIELGEILKIKNGSDYKKFNIGNIPVYGSGGIINYIDTYIYDKESVLIPRKGSIGNLFYVDKPFWTVDTIFYTVIDKDVVIPKYLYYYLSKMNLKKLNTAGGVPSLTQTVLNKILIPLPPLEEQQKIVNILDRFDKLCNDISEGLPAEIEARQKQYEYYREKLLTFKNIND
ncbi:restriction endonuclease subunit S [Fusobacterium vincentii]|uniref:Restriction endonuclease subunit S n=2 Tax=Fusobacterium vincentii TaxID=155615 RepID=A0AAJ1FLY0_FUSVC|nr:restriction endonuclease subunit S [Fusobacterium vincentii]MCW0263147.1 restriction endonuclease subunit S [Fusobacterium vincentii]STO29980.1 Type I restriction enzyme specificity protein MPN_089 [Fusobacterium vincentii]